MNENLNHRWFFLIKRLARRFGPSEMAMLVPLALIMGGIWLFAEIADEVMEQESIGFDEQIMATLRPPDRPRQPIGPSWLVQSATDITALGGFTVLILISALVSLFFWLKRRFGLMMMTISTLVGGAATSFALKLLFGRDRPGIEHLVTVSTKSFPSGHAMLSAVVYLTLGALLARSEERKQFKLFFLSAALLLTLLVGLSRIYLGVHYPTDVLAGWIAGAVWAMVCLIVAGFIHRRRHPLDRHMESDH